MNEKKVLLLTHGGWGLKLVESLSMIMGNITCCDEIPLLPSQTLQEYKELVENYVKRISRESIILTDLDGGTTTKVAMMIGLKNDIRVFCGLSAPVLLEACSQIQFQDSINPDLLYEIGKDAFKDVIKNYKKMKGDM